MTEQDLVEPNLDEPTVSAERDHPPFRMRERRLVLLPDLRPPSLDEIKWAARERRRRKDSPAPEQRRPVSHEQLEPREPADVPTTVLDEALPETDPWTLDLAEALLPDAVAPAPVLLEEPVLREEVAAPEPALQPEPEPEPEPAIADLDSLLDGPAFELDRTVFEPEPEPQPDPEPEQSAVEAAIELEDREGPEDFDLHDPEFPDLRPWRPVVLPEAEPETVAVPEGLLDPEVLVEPESNESPASFFDPAGFLDPEPFVSPELGEPTPDPGDDAAEPLVSHVLVVHEPAPVEPGRIAVLDDVETQTVTRLVPLPADPIDDLAVAAPAYDDGYVEELEDLEPELEVSTEVDGRSAPLYWRLLRLRYTRPNGWLRALYFEGAVALGVVLVLAEAASVWTIVVLPLIVAVVVKANDVLAGSLRRTYRQPRRRT